MIDDRNSAGTGTAEPMGNSAETRMGFCQECGRSLSIATLRRVGPGVFCIPCAVRHATPGWQQVPSANLAGTTIPRSRATGEPSPFLAGILGLIPGVGAMYNGQYAKGALHLIVFVILLTLADQLNWVFYWFVWGWVFYQAFDAYHTARARRDGLTLPNPFGWNDIGERLDSYRTGAAVPPVASAPPTPGPSASYAPRGAEGLASYVTAAPAAQPAYDPFTAAGTSDNPYADPLARPAAPPPFAAPGAPSPTSPVSPVASPLPAVPPGMHMPYSPTFTGHALPTSPGIPVTPLVGVRRFPTGALWLIGLGALFLFGNVFPGWHLSGRWLVPILLGAVAVWTVLRRWEQLRGARGIVPSLGVFAGALIGPALFFSVSLLLALDAGDVLTIRRSWPILLIVWGSLLTIQRTSNPQLPATGPELPAAVPTSARSTSGTGSLGL